MSYIDRHLLEGETVVYRTHLHWMLFVGPIVFLVLMAGVAWFLANSGWNSYTWVPIALALLSLVSAFIKRQSADFAVTNKRVMMKVGVLTTRSIELLLSKIEAIAVNQSLLGRMLGFGDIVITGSGGTRESFAQIQSPLEFRRAVQSVTDMQGSTTVQVPLGSD